MAPGSFETQEVGLNPDFAVAIDAIARSNPFG
jgi:hypothetical protein